MDKMQDFDRKFFPKNRLGPALLALSTFSAPNISDAPSPLSFAKIQQISKRFIRFSLYYDSTVSSCLNCAVKVRCKLQGQLKSSGFYSVVVHQELVAAIAPMLPGAQMPVAVNDIDFLPFIRHTVLLLLADP